MYDIDKTWIINAPLKRVYDRWISTDTVIPPAIRLEIEPHIGGKYLLVSRFDDKVTVMEGRFKTVLPYEKLAYSWEWNKDGNISLVLVTFADEAGKTRISLQHTGFADQQSADMHFSGWDSYIEGFKSLISD